MHVVSADRFYHDGRGPELHLRGRSASIEAIDYQLPDADGGPQFEFHLGFHRPQAYMFTPEEVVNYASSNVDWSETGRGALVSLSRSEWLCSFATRHLERCEHYRAMFYDQMLDIICEGITVNSGFFRSSK
jgi:hypothetical protein